MTAVLDDPGAIAQLDRSDMLGRIAAVPDHVRDAWGRTRALTLPETHRSAKAVAVLGMGGSAIGADLVRAVFADELRVPLVTIRDYSLPAWVTADTFVVASSYSGSTEETIAAFGAALERRSPVAVITTGGTLGEVARRAELPLLTFPGGGQPRAALGYAVMLLAGLLERAGMLSLEDASVTAAAAAAGAVARRCGPDVPTEGNPAKQLAWTLVDRLPIIEGSGFLAAVARRWKTQLNENGKSVAVAEELPEATHNAVVGYGQPESLNERLFYVFLAGPLDHPRNALRAALSAETLGAVGIPHQVVPVAGEGRLAQAFAAIVLGDYVSAYLALLYGEDPSPVEAISRIKERLSESNEESDD
jgi:glucose/mannose-6-phosphate isomerase